GNTPSSVTGTMRTDGKPYSGPIVPELTNVQQTQEDYLFKIQQGGYYGHPNAIRGEYVLNGGNPSSAMDSAQVDAYPVGTRPDINYKGFAFDFQHNKSPDGTIEYKSSTFNSALKGKILVVRYSQNDDIIVLTPGGTNKNIISYTEGAGIPGFSGFSDPLDLIENKLNGNIYVSEYGGNGQIVLLKPKTTQQVTTNVSAVADAQVRGGVYASVNYGRDSSMMIKGATNGDYKRAAYLKFNLPSINNITSAKLRFYAKNIENTSTVSISAYGGTIDGWAESTINNTNAPSATSLLGSIAVSAQLKYYEIDVTAFVKTQVAGDKIVTFLLKDASTQNIGIKINSKEFGSNVPKLVILSNESTSLIQSSITNATSPTTGLLAPISNKESSRTTGYIIPECDAPESSVMLATAVSQTVLLPIADAFVRNGTYATTNYGLDTSLIVKGSSSAGFARNSYLKFNLSSLGNVSSAKLRVYGNNIDDATAVSLSAYGIDNDAWTETAIIWNNSPTTASAPITSVPVNNVKKYYEIDVTPYIVSQVAGDKVASFLIKDATNKTKTLLFNSKENKSNRPELVIESSATAQPSNALLFVENIDKFPSNDNFVFSKIQTPWGRTDVKNSNHDSVVVRIHNKGLNPLSIKTLSLSNTILFAFDKLKGVPYSASALPLSIASGTYADLTIKFIALNQATRVKVLQETLTITSNDDVAPSKIINLHGLWQKQGEGSNEPYAQEMITAFGFKTSTGFGHTDPDKGDPLKLKGDQILSSNFLRADNSKPVYVIQMGAYHGCCTASEKIMWYAKGSTTFSTIFTHISKDGQRLLPRKSEPSSIATSIFTPSGAFGFKTGTRDYTDPALNPGGKIGLRVWKAKDENGNVIPNSFIISNDYLGSTATNYDYNDNMYFIRNIKPEVGTAYFSELAGTPSAVDFGEKLTQSSTTLNINLKSLGQVYTNGTRDPAITITSVQIVGQNSSEFSLGVLSGSSLNPQQSVTQSVIFKPTSQGLKIADLLINYTNGYGQLRVPLYGIAKASGVTVRLNYRINSGGAAITTNGKTWRKDTLAFDNLEPYKNALLTKISSSEDDAVVLTEQSSNADKRPFRYDIPLTNG
ncbi:MAG: DNRLRE domain-containing protein, partial [Ginsengibacter sp.]